MSASASLIGEQVHRLLGDVATKQSLEAAEEGRPPESLWQALEAQGLPRALLPEADGGAALSWLEAFELLEAAGYHAAPVPLCETMLAGWLLRRTGIEVPEGMLTLAAGAPQAPLRLSQGKLSGRAARVPWGGSAGHVMALAEGEQGVMLALLRGGSFDSKSGVSLASEPRDELTFAESEAVATAPLQDPYGAEALQHYGALLRACQMAGALRWLLEQSAQYANERSQFGRPIGKFQAIQQQLAVLTGEAAAAGTAAEAACRAADRGEAAFEIACAKIRAGEAATRAAAIAHQVHGAIGFTYEHPLHFFTRRLWSWQNEYGSEHAWARALGSRLTAQRADTLWTFLTSR